MRIEVLAPEISLFKRVVEDLDSMLLE